MKLQLICLRSAIACLAISNATWALNYSGGSGTADDPYQISSAQDLIDLGNESSDYDKHFILTHDIDLDPDLPTGKSFKRAPIAPFNRTYVQYSYVYKGTAFSGHFDGQGHTIYNLCIERVVGKPRLGLFGALHKEAIVENLTLDAINIEATNYQVGGLAGYNEGVIRSCYSRGTITGYSSYTGGLIGYNSGCIVDSRSYVSVSGKYSIGGLVGYSYKGSIIASYSAGSVEGTGNYVGGLVGNNFSGMVTACYSSASTTGEDYVGGLVGDHHTGHIQSCYSTGVVSGEEDHVGGLIGDRGYSVTSSFWNIETSGQTESDGGIGLSTAEMQNAVNYLNIGWDSSSRTSDGTCDYWYLSFGDYPRLGVYRGYTPIEPNGQGTLNDPYLITNAEELGVIWYRPEAHYVLAESINLSGINWISSVIPCLKGSFNGNGKFISNLYIEGGDILGLIGYLPENAQVSNLRLTDIYIVGEKNYDIGGLVGWNWGKIASCYCDGYITGAQKVGGLVGLNQYGTVLSSHTDCTTTGHHSLGGLVGVNYHGTVNACFSTGTVNGLYSMGGLIGINDLGIVSLCYSSSQVVGNSGLGGLIGGQTGLVRYCYSNGVITGKDTIGGLVAGNTGSICASYSTASVNGEGESLGGLVGELSSMGTVHSSFWDLEQTGQSTSGGGIGLSSAEMKDADLYLNSGWDFVSETSNGTSDIWKIQSQSYPEFAEFSLITLPFLGQGTSDNPYEISDANDFGLIIYDPTAHYCLVSDIDTSEISWIGPIIPRLSGSLDGNGFEISGLQIEGAGFSGLIGQLTFSASISNLNLNAANVNATGNYVGGVVGYNEGGTITAISYDGSVRGHQHVGGVCGYNYLTTLKSCYNFADINGIGDYVGGLLGYNEIGTISQCCNNGSITGHSQYVGGLIGYNGQQSPVYTSYNTGIVSGNSDYVGGLTGRNSSTIENCYSTGDVYGKGDYIGGLMGYTSSYDHPTKFCYSSGFVQGEGNYVGGLIGDKSYDVLSCFWDIETSGQTESAAGTGLTTTKMQKKITYQNAQWDLAGEATNGTKDIWRIDTGNDYPRLWWQ